MSDIRTVFTDQEGKWLVEGPGLAEDDGLETAVIISLFTDRLADVDDALPDGGDDRRGWWADSLEAEPDRIGSRLWLLSRSKQIPSVLRNAETYAREALQWLIDDGIARSIDVTAEVSAPGLLGLLVVITRSSQPIARYRFDAFWKGDLNAVL